MSPRYPAALLGPAVLIAAGLIAIPAAAQSAGSSPAHDHGGQHHHGHGAAETKPVERPKVFLDKSPRIVAYQLKRLDNQRLLLVERSTDDPKYIPVYEAILTRDGISPQHREEAVSALATLKQADRANVLLEALADLSPRDMAGQQTADQLAEMLLGLPREELRNQLETIRKVADSGNELSRSVAYAAMMAAGEAEAAWENARQDADATQAWLAGVGRVPSDEVRGEMRPRVVSLVEPSTPVELRQAAIETLASIPTEQAATFELVAPLVADESLRESAVRTLLAVPKSQRDAEAARVVLGVLVEMAEATPPEDRTTDAFIDAMQLADELMAPVPVELARSARERLREVTVRVVRIRTVEEEMRYDTPYFAVEAGRPVQIVLQNEDLMPHNLVITVPGALKEVAQMGLAVGPTGGWEGKQYVPESDKVLHATHMVQPHQQERLTFDAPTEPGEYPYVCTFPQHWYRMYGVMVVVEDLDAWLQNPTEPANPIGSNRAFVQAWTVDDFAEDLESGMRGRSPEIGMRLLAEASCLGCHRVDEQGGEIGPELNGVFERWKGDARAVLREILEPSHRIDDQYAMHMVLTAAGQTYTGVVKEQNDETVTLLSSPEAKEPTVIPQDEIDQMVKTPTSMMPKALLDQYTRDEVFEILACLKSLEPTQP